MRIPVFLTILLALTLPACERLSVLITPLPERITLAFPPAAAIDSARAALAGDSDETQKEILTEKFNDLLATHALQCSDNNELGRFDSVAEIRQRIKNPDCFKKRDVLLLDWLGRQRMALILNQPPPHAPPAANTTTPLLLPQGTTVINSLSRAGSDIMALQTYAGWLTVRHSSGKLLQELPASTSLLPGWVPQRPSLSPNGRLLAIQRSNAANKPELVVLETSSGEEIWRSEQELAILNWWPKLPALTTLTRTEEGLVGTLFDLQGEHHVRYQWTGKTPVISTEIAPAQLLLGGEHALLLFRHWRAENKLRPNPTASWQLKNPLNGQKTAAPFNNSEKLFYLSGDKLAWLEMASGQQGAHALRAARGSAAEFVKINDTHILLALQTAPAQHSSRWVFNTKTATLAKVLPAGDAATNSVLPLQTPLIQLQTHEQKARLVLHNALHIGAPVAIDSVLTQNTPQSPPIEP